MQKLIQGNLKTSILLAMPKKPQLEDIIPLRRDGSRNWSSLNDRELLAYATKFLEQKGIDGRAQFQKANPGLSHILWRRKLLDRLKLEDKERKLKMLDAGIQDAFDFNTPFEDSEIRAGYYELGTGYQESYEDLLRRAPLDLVFSDSEEAKRKIRRLGDLEDVEPLSESLNKTNS